MIAPDANLLVYAVNSESPFHNKAKTWLDQILSETEPVGFAWATLVGFRRLVTRSAVVPKPLSAEQALELVALWLARPNVSIVGPGPRHFELLRTLLTAVGTAGNLTSDAHLAAIALEHAAEVHSTDNDFGRFPGLRWRNPFAS